MLQILFLIFPLLIAEDDHGILNNPPPKSMTEFLDEQKPPPAPESQLTVTYVTVKQNSVVIKLSDGRVFLVHPKYSAIAEGWTLGPEVAVKLTRQSEGFPYTITRVGSNSFVYARKIEDTGSTP